MPSPPTRTATWSPRIHRSDGPKPSPTARWFAFGRGLAGFFGNPHPDPWWLPAGFTALWVLAKQDGRIQDRWPRRHRSLEAHVNLIHVDAYTATAAMVILAGIISLILALANPVR